MASRDANFAICWLLVISGKEMWAVVSSALALARQNPTPFVSAVRIVEREEALDQGLLEERGRNRSNSRPLPPQRPRCWRASFLQVSTNSYQPFFSIVMPNWILKIHLSGISGKRFGTVSSRFFYANAWTRPGRSPLSSPAQYYDWPGHCMPPAGALCPASLSADGSLPEGHPPMFT